MHHAHALTVDELAAARQAREDEKNRELSRLRDQITGTGTAYPTPAAIRATERPTLDELAHAIDRQLGMLGTALDDHVDRIASILTTPEPLAPTTPPYTASDEWSPLAHTLAALATRAAGLVEHLRDTTHRVQL